MTSLAHHFFEQTAARFPSKPYLVAGESVLTFAEIDHRSDCLALRLWETFKVRRGDRVVGMLGNSVDAVIALWATLKTGAIYVPLGTTLKEEKLAFVLSDCNARVVIANALNAERIGQAVAASRAACDVLWADEPLPEGTAFTLPPDASNAVPIAEDVCLLIYTSGSTGVPKGVMLTHGNVCNSVAAITGYLANSASDVVLCVLPLCYSYGLFQILGGAYVGYTCLIEKSFAYPQDVLRRASAWRVTGFAGVPTMFNALLQLAPFEGVDLSSLRYMTNAAAALAPSHVVRLRSVLPHVDLVSMYGLTECTRVSFLEPSKARHKPGSVGKPMSNCAVFIVDDSGQPVRRGEFGELVVRGANVMRGYWNRPEQTAQVLRNGPVAGERVLYTGDLFQQDEDGDLHFVARKDDIFKSGGAKVSPCEIENVLYEMEAIAEAAVVGVADRGDIAIKAFVVARDGCTVTESMVRRHCKERLEAMLVPKYIEVRAALPKTDSGKITRAVLRHIEPLPA